MKWHFFGYKWPEKSLPFRHLKGKNLVSYNNFSLFLLENQLSSMILVFLTSLYILQQSSSVLTNCFSFLLFVTFSL